MGTRKITNNELNNVSGGASDKRVTCPKCKQQVLYMRTLVRIEPSACGDTYYFKCPRCDHEWSK